MFKKRKPTSLDDLGEEHLYDEKIMKEIEMDMLKNIHKQIRKPWLFKTISVKYVLAATVLLFAVVALWFSSAYNGNVKTLSLTAAQGRISIINLPDGSKIWLNSGSTISYPEKFAKIREVRLVNGEAFFDIKHDINSPFIVRYGNLHAQVLGTSFNI